MSYRNIKRVLGESSLERKIRILFGISLLILIAVSFLWVNRITEDLIRKNTRDKAHELTSDFMLREHLKNVKIQKDADLPGEQVVQKLADLVESTPYQAEALVIDNRVGRNQLSPTVVTDPAELELLSRIADAARQEQERQNRLYVWPSAIGDRAADSSKSNHFAEYFPNNQKYVYYTPVLFKPLCADCHAVVRDASDATFAKFLDPKATETEKKQAEFEMLQQEPLVFLRITLNYNEAKSAINHSRAILMAVAIATAFLSMIALYLIVRYVIVKPLRHLRDVTEEVSHGRMDVRAELNTGDEFEQLSRSLNRMLRHLLDTQSALQNANHMK
jgi:methyl-accepting chemotaxis protein